MAFHRDFPLLSLRRTVLTLFLVSLLVAPAIAEDSPHLLLGNPSGAKHDPAEKNNFLMVKENFALSYNDSKGTPNWVSWRLIARDLGDAPRKRVFDTDITLPDGFKRVETADYRNSGFDRGHMCPHSDRASTKETSYSTFIMTNIIPQAPNVNEKTWDELEAYCRTLVADDKNHLYIAAGPGGKGGRGANGTKSTLQNGKVVVPSVCWKVIVVVPCDGPNDTGKDDLKKVDADTRVIAVIMPNDNSIGLDWTEYRVPVSEVEAQTGLSFFDKLPKELASQLKEEPDSEPVGQVHIPVHAH